MEEFKPLISTVFFRFGEIEQSLFIFLLSKIYFQIFLYSFFVRSKQIENKKNNDCFISPKRKNKVEINGLNSSIISPDVKKLNKSCQHTFGNYYQLW